VHSNSIVSGELYDLHQCLLFVSLGVSCHRPTMEITFSALTRGSASETMIMRSSFAA
jgi:hypothetical protein